MNTKTIDHSDNKISHLHSKATATASSHSFQKMKCRSTIYQRHEKRMFRSRQNMGDTRPAPIRVLSGLPGFYHFVKPYKPNSETETSSSSRGDNCKNSKLRKKSNTSLNFFKESNDNKFSTHNGQNDRSLQAKDETIRASSIVFLSGCVGGTMEAVFGRSNNDVLSRATRQVALLASNVNFQQNDKSLRPLLQATANNNVVFSPSISQSLHSHSLQKSFESANKATNERIIASAFAAGLLFTSNAYFRQKFCTNDSNHDDNNVAMMSSQTSHPFAPSFIAASLATGFVTASVFAPFELVRSRLLLQLAASNSFISPFVRSSEMFTSMSSRLILREMASVINKHGFAALYKGGTEVYSREMIGKVAYFSMYELMKSNISSKSHDDSFEHTEQASASEIMLSGGLAGVAYWAVIYPLDTLKAMTQVEPITSPRFRTTQSIVNEIGFANLYRGYLSCVMRAAPANAALFLGYESAQKLFSEKDM